ncbi:MAG: DEAD/DEAH box helicase [Bacteroidota bacterium]
MDREFIIGLKEHRIFGWIAKAYWVEKKNKEFFTVVESVSGKNLGEKITEYSETQQKLIKITDQYTDSEITKLFSKKKLSTRDFISKFSDEALKVRIREYIEKRLIKLLDVQKDSNISLFFNSDSKNVYSEDKITIQSGFSETVFNFSKEEEGSKYFLTVKNAQSEINLYNKAGYIITNSPCSLLLENKLYFFKPEPEGIDGKKILPFLVKEHIIIPKTAEKKYFETFVLKSIEKYKVNAKGFKIIRLPIVPKPVLLVEKDWKDKFTMILKFDYDGNLVSPSYGKKRFVRAKFDEDNYAYEQIDRDLGFEKEKSDFLQSVGLKKTGEYNYKILSDEDVPIEDTALIQWLNQFGSVLKENGFDVQQKFFNKKYFIEKAWIDFKVNDRNDWFDIKATVNFGGFSVPFMKLKNHIKNNNNEFVLPNGEIAIIPEEWFSKYRDFILFSEQKGNDFRLEKHHFQVLSNDIEDIDQELVKKMNQMSHQEFSVSPKVNAKLRPYQKLGYDWINSLYQNKFGACLADDMGLGKTLQTLAVIRRIMDLDIGKNGSVIKKRKAEQLSLFEQVSPEPKVDHIEKVQGKRAGLIVMPTSLVHNWMNEINKFTPDIKTYAYTGTRREKNIEHFSNFDLILTSYGIVRNDIDILKDYHFNFLFLDESQTIKNPLSKTYKLIMEITANNKMVLTGTPIENTLTDLWAQMNFINPGLLGTLNFFKEEFVDPIEKHQDAILKEEKQEKLQKIIRPFFLRRTKEEVANDLPDLTETVHYCSMSEEQHRIYEEEKSKIRNVLINSFGKKKSTVEKNMLIIQALTKLRQLANHTKLIEEKDDNPSGKFDEIIRMLESLRAENHKVLIFSSFVKHLNIFEDYFKDNEWKYSMLTGKTTKREEVINEFQSDPENSLFLISLKAGGSGLNLTAADYVFILDPWWNPASERQAIARAHRIGQQKKVMAYRFITEGSIEEKILKFQEKKQELADVFINNNNSFAKLSETEILNLFD